MTYLRLLFIILVFVPSIMHGKTIVHNLLPEQQIKIVNEINGQKEINCPQIINASDSMVSKQVHVYKFANSTKGEFLHGLCDSIADNSPISNGVLIRPTFNKGALTNYLTLQSLIILPSDVRRAIGVIILNDYKIVILFDDDSEWISKAGIEKTDLTISLRYGKEYIPDEFKDTLFIPEGDYILATVSIETFDLRNFFIEGEKLQDSNKNIAKGIVEWWESFCERHGILPRYTYMRQKDWIDVYQYWYNHRFY